MANTKNILLLAMVQLNNVSLWFIFLLNPALKVAKKCALNASRGLHKTASFNFLHNVQLLCQGVQLFSAQNKQLDFQSSGQLGNKELERVGKKTWLNKTIKKKECVPILLMKI